MNRRRFAFGGVLAAVISGSSSVYGRVSNALSGGAFVLDGAEARLADVLAPREEEAYGAPSLAALSSLLSGGGFAFEDAAPADRWGRRVIHGRAAGEGAGLAERLVAAGAARVRPETDNAALIEALLSAEAAARAARRGLWALRDYAIVDALDANGAVGRFALVEGVVKATAAVSGRFYLNFDDDFRTDFSVSAPSRAARSWARRGLDLMALEGARVRVRGHVAWINGPLIELLHPQALEAL